MLSPKSSDPTPTPPPQAINNDCYLKRGVKVGVGPAAGVEVYLFNLILILFFFYCIQSKEDKGDREGIPHTHPIPQVIRLELFLRPQIPKGIRKQPTHGAKVFRVDDPRSEPRVLHELTQNKLAEDEESDIAIRFVGKNDQSFEQLIVA